MGASHSKKLPKKDLIYLLEHTEFKRPEILKWHRQFMEECPDGKLTMDKFLQIYEQLPLEGNAHKFCGHVFRSFDRDGNGYIEFREFMLAVSITSPVSCPEVKLSWSFDMYDIDGNGCIERKEMEHIIRAIYDMLGSSNKDPALESPEERTAKIFSKMDTNKDGVLSKEEFTDGCLQDPVLYDMLTIGSMA